MGDNNIGLFLVCIIDHYCPCIVTTHILRQICQFGNLKLIIRENSTLFDKLIHICQDLNRTKMVSFVKRAEYTFDFKSFIVIVYISLHYLTSFTLCVLISQLLSTLNGCHLENTSMKITGTQILFKPIKKMCPMFYKRFL